MHVHILTPEHRFIAEGAVDPIQKEKLKPGDRIVVCAHCGSPFLVESWEFAHAKHGGINNTKQNIINNNQSIKISKPSGSRARIQAPPIYQPAYTPPLDIRRPVDIRRPATARMEPSRSKAVGWMLAMLFLVVTGGFLWQKYMSKESLTSIPSSTTFQRAQSEEKSRTPKDQNPKPLSQEATSSFTPQPEDSSEGTESVGLENSEQIFQDTTSSSVVQIDSSGQNATNLEPIIITINSSPAGARVYHNDRLVGETRVQFEVRPGKYRLLLVKDGYSPYRAIIRISPTLTTEFFYTLSEEK